MLASLTELRVVYRQLRIARIALESVRELLGAANPRLFPVASNAYIRRIDALECEIAQYLVHDSVDEPLVVGRYLRRFDRTLAGG